MYASGALAVLALLLIQLGMWQSAHTDEGAVWINAGVVVAVVGPLAAVAWASLRVRGIVNRSSTAQ